MNTSNSESETADPVPLHAVASYRWVLAALLFTTSCVHKKAVVFEHDASSGQNRMTYRGKPISVTELYELGEKADEDQIDLIMRQDGKEQKLDLKRWHTGMKLLPTAILRMPGDLVD
jgi:hypothetical protein